MARNTKIIYVACNARIASIYHGESVHTFDSMPAILMGLDASWADKEIAAITSCFTAWNSILHIAPNFA